MVIVMIPITFILLSRPAPDGWPELFEIYSFYPFVIKENIEDNFMYLSCHNP
jgi:hypothetical protein